MGFLGKLLFVTYATTHITKLSTTKSVHGKRISVPLYRKKLLFTN